jgi:LuxR family maltose regulon positive regulatory protein
MTELRANDLRFSSSEIAPFMKECMQLDLSANQIQSLESRTEGWIAGLQMAGISLKGKTDIDAFLSAFGGSHRFILDYLTDEVLNGQSKEIQDFILQTSILDRLSGPLCEAVTGQDKAQDTLEKLDKNNLFLIPLDDERGWYRYHHLFAEVMANRLERKTPDLVSKLHLQAAKWFQKNGLFVEAVEHSLNAKAYPLAVEIVDSQALNLLKTGNLSTLSGWLNQFPPEIVNEHPSLSVASAWVYLLIGKQDRVADYLLLAQKNLGSIDDSDELRGQIAAIHTYMAARNEKPEEAIRLAQEALELLSEENLAIRCVVAFVLGGAYYMHQDFPNALKAMQEAGDLGEKAGNLHLAVSAFSSKGDMLLSQGKIAESEKTYLKALRLGTGRSGKPLPFTASVHSGLARLHLEKNDLNLARHYAQTGLELGGKWVNPDSQVSCSLTIAKIESIEGNFSEARSALEHAKQLAADRDLFPGLDERISEYEEAILSAPSGKLNQTSLPEPLTERELEVLQLIAAGMSNRAIAEELVIALGTAKTHISRIMGKLNAENRTQAVVKARELGLVE